MASVFDYEPRVLCGAAVNVCKHISISQSTSHHWSRLREDELWYELAACILGSQVPYQLAIGAADFLRSRHILDYSTGLGNLERYERKLANALLRRSFPSETGVIRRRYRFPFIRAKQLRRTVENIYLSGSSLQSILAGCETSCDARERLVFIAAGVGPKQASLFLRNIGFADDLAILDVHVLRYMQRLGLYAASAESIRTLKGYERAESAFCRHALTLGFSPSHFDLAVWVVVRASSR